MNLKELLLKLHYLGLEINEIYRILKKLYEEKTVNEVVLKRVLNEKYREYLAIDYEKVIADLKTSGTNFFTILDSEYPKLLENIFMPPVVLFYKGKIELLKTFTLAVVGTRNNSNYGTKVTEDIVAGLVKKGITIASGLAYGIDYIAHTSCIKNNGSTIAVLGSGFNNIYPWENIELANQIAYSHLLLSEYPPHTKPSKTHFPFRNRIVSGISQGLLVVEAKEKSGTLITCDYALDQGKEIFVIPGSIYEQNSVGTNNLIKQGAKLVTNVLDILETFHL